MKLYLFVLFALCILLMVVILPIILSLLKFFISVAVVLTGATILYIIIMFVWGFFRV